MSHVKSFILSLLPSPGPCRSDAMFIQHALSRWGAVWKRVWHVWNFTDKVEPIRCMEMNALRESLQNFSIYMVYMVIFDLCVWIKSRFRYSRFLCGLFHQKTPLLLMNQLCNTAVCGNVFVDYMVLRSFSNILPHVCSSISHSVALGELFGMFLFSMLCEVWGLHR